MDPQRIGRGVVAGLIGGVAFGALMHMTGMLDLVAGLVGQTGAGVGWVVHLVISAVVGALYGVTFGQRLHGWGGGTGFGLLYGLIWWVLGPLLLMPLAMGMPVFQVGEVQVQSLMGHVIFGLVTGLSFVALTGSAATADDRSSVHSR